MPIGNVNEKRNKIDGTVFQSKTVVVDGIPYKIVEDDTNFGDTTTIIEAARPYKSYSGFIYAAGLSDPIVDSVFENTIGAIEWTRYNDGYYIGTLTGAFVADKTFCYVGNDVYEDGTSAQVCSLHRINANTVKLKVFDASTDGYASNLNGVHIEIRVYN